MQNISKCRLLKFYPECRVANTMSVLTGGGALHLHTRYVIVEGTIEASGNDGSTYIGGGSGGGIYISALELEGSGSIAVMGGNGGSYAGGGGGGRVWISYESTRYWFGEFKAEGGTGYRIGGAGTVYLEVGIILLPTRVSIICMSCPVMNFHYTHLLYICGRIMLFTETFTKANFVILTVAAI